MKNISRTVVILSLVSLLTDMASEMLYPVIPLYLQQMGYSIITIGLLEGFAEAIAGLSKGFFGKQSDYVGKRLPFVQIGYCLSAISKPLMALIPNIWWIFGSRSLDRIGKGIRTGARDALLSAEATTQTKATVFGFHRSMDTLGAAIGPALALLFLYFNPGNYKLLFYFAFIPGLLAVVSSLFIKERPFSPKTAKKINGFFSFFNYIKKSSKQYKRLLITMLLFALVNSSDVFLLLQMKQNGISDTVLVGVYIFYNAIYALVAFPVGKMADKIGLKQMLVIGLLLFCIVYGGMAYANSLVWFGVLFLLYGLYAAASEGIVKAWISNIVPQHETGSAIGTYAALQSICALIASTIAGLIWFNFGSDILFIATAVVAFFISIYILIKIEYQPIKDNF